MSLTYKSLTLKAKAASDDIPDIPYKSHWYSNGVAGQPLYLTVMHRVEDGGLNFNFEYRYDVVSQSEMEYLYYYPEDGVITAEVFPNTDLCPDTTEAAKQLHEIIDEVNKTLPSAKNIHRLRVRTEGFDKTASRKIRRNQTSKGEIM